MKTKKTSISVGITSAGPGGWHKMTKLIMESLAFSLVISAFALHASAQSCFPAPSGIVSWWRAETNTLDSVGVNNGTAINSLGYERGEVGLAFSLDGSSSYVLVQSSDPSLNVGAGTGMTIEGWINPATVSREELLSEWERILGSGSGADVGVNFAIEPSGELFVNFKSTTGTDHTLASPSGALTNNVWQHVAMTYDISSGVGVLYVNGAAVASQSFGSFTPQTSYTNLVIGARTYLATEAAPRSVFDGGMDEWTIYQRALSQCEIDAIFAAGSSGKCPTSLLCDPPPSGIASWWRAETNTIDSIGVNNGTAINSLGYEPGEVGLAFSLDGSSSYVLVQSSDPSLNVGAGTGMTIEGWINPTVVNREQLLSEWERVLGSGSGADVGVNFAIEPTGELFVNFKSTTGTDHTLATPSGALTNNVWQHVAMTYDISSGSGVLYVNGAAVASQTFSSFTPQTSFTNLVIGARTYLATEAAPRSVFDGGMDEWSIYQRALSECEVHAIYAAGTSGKCPP